MPYKITGSTGNYKLILQSTGKVLGHHKTKKEAQKQIAAIEISKLKRKK